MASRHLGSLGFGCVPTRPHERATRSVSSANGERRKLPNMMRTRLILALALGCLALCSVDAQVCDDDFVLAVGGDCVDNNSAAFDGCSPNCRKEKVGICDLAQSCGIGFPSGTETCDDEARQSTYWFNDKSRMPETNALDGDAETCIRTGNPPSSVDVNPQWFRVDLEEIRLIQTVRITADSSALGGLEGFKVWVSASDAAADASGHQSSGAELPAAKELCYEHSGAVTETVMTVTCAVVTKGRFVFVTHGSPSRELRLCEVEIFSHECLAEDAPLMCGLGYEPSTCESCRGCVPCGVGTYSDEIGDKACRPCPGPVDEARPYSPEGSTSEFQCEGDAFLDGSSTFEIKDLEFDQGVDSWTLQIEYSIAPRTEVSALFLSMGGDNVDETEESFDAMNFPCGADTSRARGADYSSFLAETVCCLQDFRADYIMTRAFRTFTDNLDLVAANDICDGPTGSNMIKGAQVPLVTALGEGDEAPGPNEFVDTAGNGYANKIVVVHNSSQTDSTLRRTGTATVVIPDAELYKISRSVNPPAGDEVREGLTDARELFIGMMDLTPTGTRVLDATSQQISVVLTRTQYGAFAAYGAQNIDYTFISFLNGRVYKVLDQREPQRRDLGTDGNAYYAAVSFVWDDSLHPATSLQVVDASSLKVTYSGGAVPVCEGSFTSDWLAVVSQQCGPQQNIQFGVVERCPQVIMTDDKFAQIYIPLDSSLDAIKEVKIEFEIVLEDAEGKNASLSVDMVLMTTDSVTLCAEAKGEVDLASLVVPRLLIGSENEAPPRLFPKANPFTLEPSEAETLQDGLVTLILEFDATQDSSNLEVFIEDVLVVHINPGADAELADVMAGFEGNDANFTPTYQYDPDSRDAWLVIPPALNASCPHVQSSESFFGCVHKHILADEAVVESDDAYVIGAGGAQDWMAAMLGDGTATVSARQLGLEFERYLVNDVGVAGPQRKGLWINPGHVWGATLANAQVSLSQNLFVYVLYGVRAGVETRRKVLQISSSGAQSVGAGIQFKVDPASFVADVLGANEELVSAWQLKLEVEEEYACLAPESLTTWLKAKLADLLKDQASPVQTVELLRVGIENADCDGARRLLQTPTATIETVIVLEDTAKPFINWAGVPGLVSVKQTGGPAVAVNEAGELPTTNAQGEVIRDGEPVSDADASASSDKKSDDQMTLIIMAAGGALGVIVLGFVGYVGWKRCGRSHLVELNQVVYSVPQHGTGRDPKTTLIETLLFSHEAATVSASVTHNPWQAGAPNSAPVQDVTLDQLVGSGSKKKLLEQPATFW